MRLHRLSRKIHRLVVPIAVTPIVLVAFSGALYGTLINFNIEWSWLLKMHTGNFGVLNLQPYYSPILGALTLVVAASGIFLLIPRKQSSKIS
jgi:uncharacterized iron-regulated membrane protein